MIPALRRSGALVVLTLAASLCLPAVVPAQGQVPVQARVRGQGGQAFPAPIAMRFNAMQQGEFIPGGASANDGALFQPTRVKQDTLDALMEVRALLEERAWPQAFDALDDLATDVDDGLLPVNDQWWLSTGAAVRSLLAGLPAEGLAAFNVFHGAAAEQALARAGRHDAAALRAIVDRWFVTPAGGEAARRLGDLAFSQGRFRAAERWWTLRHTNHPIPVADPARLALQRAIVHLHLQDEASARSLLGAFDPETRVLVAGAERSIREVFDAALAERSTRPATHAASVTSGLPDRPERAAPDLDQPAWSARLTDDATLNAIRQQLAQFTAVGASIDPTVAGDASTVHVHWLGLVRSFDVASGEVRRENGPGPEQIVRSVRRFGAYGTLARDSIGMTEAGLVVARPTEQGPVAIAVLDADGRTRWSSDGDALLSRYSMGPRPVLDDGVLYATATLAGQFDLHLLAMDPATGRLLWTVRLGEAGQAAAGGRLGHALPNPQGVILPRAEQVVVVTNAGGVVGVSRDGSGLLWAFNEPVNWTGQRNPNTGHLTFPDQPAAGAWLPGGLTFHQSGAGYVRAIDPESLSQSWRAELDTGDARPLGLIGGVWLYGEQGLVALASDTGAVRWRSRHLGEVDSVVAVNGVLVASGERGVMPIDASSGLALAMPRPLAPDIDGVWTLHAGPGWIAAVHEDRIRLYRTR